jgi:hypothetical protein
MLGFTSNFGMAEKSKGIFPWTLKPSLAEHFSEDWQILALLHGSSLTVC